MKKKYQKPEIRVIAGEAETAQCVTGWTPSASGSNSCASGPAANFLCNAGNWADTQCYSGFNAIGPAEPNCLAGNAAGTSCGHGTSAGSQNTTDPTACEAGFSPV